MGENYRKIYEDYYGIKIKKNMEIHHIDLNHDNNDISNLVALPKELHQEYHRILMTLKTNKTRFSIEVALKGGLAFRYNLDQLQALCDILEKCKPYLIIKELYKGE